jgi:hypothetical protein
VPTLLQLLEVARRRLDGDLAGKQVVDREAAGDFDDVAFAATALELLQQDDLHGYSFRGLA